MLFINVLGHNNIKDILIKEVSNNRIPHAQLFDEHEEISALPMALAFSMYLFCQNRTSSDSCGKCSSCKKMLKLVHPDIHFFFPSKSVGTVKSGSKLAFPDFQKQLLENPYFNESDWYKSIKIKNSGEIRVSDARVINKITNLKSYEGGYKIFIIWHAEKLNSEASNKLLKNIEEPNSKTIFILITKAPNQLLSTIHSRLQTKKFNKLTSQVIKNRVHKLFPELKDKDINTQISLFNNNYNQIIKHLSGELKNENNYNLFIDWVRLCFLAKNKKQVYDLVEWCNNTAALEKTKQLDFVKTSLEIIRFSYLAQYGANISLPQTSNSNFNFIKFAERIKSNNISEFVELLNNAFFALDRYANSKILFLDLSFSIGKLLHK